MISQIQTTYPMNEAKHIPSKRSENVDANKARQKHAKNQSIGQQYDSGRVLMEDMATSSNGKIHG